MSKNSDSKFSKESESAGNDCEVLQLHLQVFEWLHCPVFLVFRTSTSNTGKMTDSPDSFLWMDVAEEWDLPEQCL